MVGRNSNQSSPFHKHENDTTLWFHVVLEEEKKLPFMTRFTEMMALQNWYVQSRTPTSLSIHPYKERSAL